MSEQITINLTQPKEEITFAYTEQGEVITFSFSEAARGPAGSEASVTNANVNAAIDSDPAATRAALELGSAALADTGTGASNVILGNDARLTDARTPTAHASSHVTGGTDKIRDASAAQDGLMTTAFASKLNGIEAGADVTDSANVNAAGAVMESDYTPSHSLLVQQSGTGSPSSLSIGNNTLVGRLSGGGSAIDDLSASQVRTLLNVEDGADVTDAANVASTITGATAKTTLVDADETVLTDSAASFGLKKVTWANVFAYILTKIQAAASIVFTGQLRSTNQTAATSDALMTRGLIVPESSQDPWLPVFLGNPQQSGSGALATLIGMAGSIGLNNSPTGAYASLSSGATFPMAPFARYGSGAGFALNAGTPEYSIIFHTSNNGFGTTHLKMLFGTTAGTVVDLAAAGLAVVFGVDSAAISVKLQYHDGSTLFESAWAATGGGLANNERWMLTYSKTNGMRLYGKVSADNNVFPRWTLVLTRTCPSPPDYTAGQVISFLRTAVTADANFRSTMVRDVRMIQREIIP